MQNTELSKADLSLCIIAAILLRKNIFKICKIDLTICIVCFTLIIKEALKYFV